MLCFSNFFKTMIILTPMLMFQFGCGNKGKKNPDQTTPPPPDGINEEKLEFVLSDGSAELAGLKSKYNLMANLVCEEGKEIFQATSFEVDPGNIAFENKRSDLANKHCFVAIVSKDMAQNSEYSFEKKINLNGKDTEIYFSSSLFEIKETKNISILKNFNPANGNQTSINLTGSISKCDQGKTSDFSKASKNFGICLPYLEGEINQIYDHSASELAGKAAVVFDSSAIRAHVHLNKIVEGGKAELLEGKCQENLPLVEQSSLASSAMSSMDLVLEVQDQAKIAALNTSSQISVGLFNSSSDLIGCMDLKSPSNVLELKSEHIGPQNKAQLVCQIENQKTIISHTNLMLQGNSVAVTFSLPSEYQAKEKIASLQNCQILLYNSDNVNSSHILLAATLAGSMHESHRAYAFSNAVSPVLNHGSYKLEGVTIYPTIMDSQKTIFHKRLPIIGRSFASLGISLDNQLSYTCGNTNLQKQISLPSQVGAIKNITLSSDNRDILDPSCVLRVSGNKLQGYQHDDLYFLVREKFDLDDSHVTGVWQPQSLPTFLDADSFKWKLSNHDGDNAKTKRSTTFELKTLPLYISSEYVQPRSIRFQENCNILSLDSYWIQFLSPDAFEYEMADSLYFFTFGGDTTKIGSSTGFYNFGGVEYFDNEYYDTVTKKVINRYLVGMWTHFTLANNNIVTLCTEITLPSQPIL